MDLLLILYLVIGVASFIILITIMLLGGMDLDFDGGPDIDLDLGDIDADVGGGPGLFSLPVMLSFTSAFGGLGAIMTYFDVDPVLTPFIAAGSSLVFSVLLFLLVRYGFKVFSSDSTVKYDRLKGKKATVTVPINPGMEGQVTLFTEQRGRTLIPAVADRQFGNNAEVVISQNLGDSVKVVSYSDWKRNRSRSKKRTARQDNQERRER